MLERPFPVSSPRSHKSCVRVAGEHRINKSQGQSLENVSLYLPRPVFAHGQLYVALSRVGNPDWIKVLVIDSKEQGTFDKRDGVYTVNIVYPEILVRARELLEKSLAARASVATLTATTAAPSTSRLPHGHLPCLTSYGLRHRGVLAMR